jgi:outer membrane protein
MKKVIFLSIIAVFTLVSTVSAQTPKFGYTNSAALLSQLPEVKSADANIQAFQTQLQKQGQQMVETLKGKYDDLAKKEKLGEIAPKILQEEAEKLKGEEAKIGQFEQEMNKKVTEKREALLQPILDKVNKAIADVSKEQGFTYVFDSSTSILLYADETLDVTKAVKVKLGIQ